MFCKFVACNILVNKIRQVMKIVKVGIIKCITNKIANKFHSNILIKILLMYHICTKNHIIIV